MPSITFDLSADEYAILEKRASIVKMKADAYAKSVLLESVEPRTATAKEIAKTIGTTEAEVRSVLAGMPSEASAETVRGIKAMAGEMGYRPTVKDIAAAAGMSPMAVSYALRGSEGDVSLKTIRRVKAIAKRMGWRSSAIAGALRRRYR